MTHISPENDGHIPLPLSAAQEAQISRAAALQRMDVDQFVTGAASRQADAVRVSARDFARIVELLEYPPAPNARLRAAIAALPDL